MVNRIVTGAHYGLLDWLATTRYCCCDGSLYSISNYGHYLFLHHMTIATVERNIFQSVDTYCYLVPFFVSLCWHAWIGMRNILMDYIHETSIRLTIQVLVIFSLFFMPYGLLKSYGVSWYGNNKKKI